MKASASIMAIFGLLSLSPVAMGRDNRSETEVVEALMQSTNTWGRSISQYREVVSTNMAAVCGFGRNRAPRLSERWYEVMLELPLCTNDICNWSAWLNEKTFPLWAFGGIFVEDVASTNIWLRIADFMGEVRGGLKTADEIRVESGGDKQRFLDLQTEMAARRYSDSALRDVVVDGIGQRGLPLLSPDIRFSFFSNLVQRARLTVSEMSQIGANLSGD